MNHIFLPAKPVRKFHGKNIVGTRFKQVVYVVAEIKSTIVDIVIAGLRPHKKHG